MEFKEKLGVVSKLQKISASAYSDTAPKLQIGMSEKEIEALIREEFKKRGVIDFWYDLPIIVLVGTERFIHGVNADYATKGPSASSFLKEGDSIYIDVHPQDSKTGVWGDWNTMAVFHPKESIDDEQVAFLDEMRAIHREGIAKLTATMTGADVMDYFFKKYQEKGIAPLTDTKDIGHTIHEGLKVNAKRLFLNAENMIPIGGYFYAIEPGGFRAKKSGDGVLVGRFEECVYIPQQGSAIMLGNQE